MIQIRRFVVISVAMPFVFAGCATTQQFIKLELGMTKVQVIETVGEPNLARGSIQNKYGQLIEVWEYYRFESNWSPDKKRMWVYFADGRLVQWGQAGDWAREADRIYEIRFR
jgi:outer membrane protein assembly factor BamE (lipoprotein component of BamABCDE complex)